MTIFLTEDVVQTKTVSLEEAMQDIVGLSIEAMELNEALLIADYRTDVKVKSLSEEGQEEKAKEQKDGLVKRAGAALKDFGAKAKAKIIALYQSVKAKVTAYWAKFIARAKDLIGKGKKLKVSKKGWAAIKDAVKIAKQLTSSKVLADNVKSSELISQLQAKVAEAREASGDETEINESALNTLAATAKEAAEAIKGIAEAAVAETAPDAARKAQQKAIQAASIVAGLATAVPSVIKGASAAPAEEAK